MENGQDKKSKDKQLPEEEIFGELDAMYQRVADIEKEEASEVMSQEEAKNKPKGGFEMGQKKKPGRNKNRSYRPIILGAVAVLFAIILVLTFWKPVAILQLLNLGGTKQPTVSAPPRPRKPPAVVTPQAPPAPPAVATSPAPPKPPSAIAPSAPPSPPAVASTAFPKTSSDSPQAQAKQETVKTLREDSEKTKPASQEMVKAIKPTPQGRYYAIQVGSFRNMQYVRDLTEVLKKEGLDAYWLTMESKKGETLYRVFVGQFTDKNDAAQFLKDKKALKNYPGSFIQEVSSSKVIEGNM